MTRSLPAHRSTTAPGGARRPRPQPQIATAEKAVESVGCSIFRLLDFWTSRLFQGGRGRPRSQVQTPPEYRPAEASLRIRPSRPREFRSRGCSDP